MARTPGRGAGVIEMIVSSKQKERKTKNKKHVRRHERRERQLP
jgi:hypothetical protein